MEDKNWMMNNVLPVMFEGLTIDEDLYNRHTYTFEKIKNSDTQTYIIQAKSTYSIAALVSYKDGKVIVSKKSIEASEIGGPAEGVVVDIENGFAREVPDSYDTEYCFYKINNGEFEPVLNWEFGKIVNGMETRNHYYNGETISGEEYSKKAEEYSNKYDYQNISKKLTTENIDKYVK